MSSGALVDDLGAGTYLFRWPRGYRSPFVVTAEGVVAVDPISAEAAALYRQAIRSVTDAPVVAVIYSHYHRDHVVGAAILAPEADLIIAHPRTAAFLERHPYPDTPLPTRLVDGAGELAFGEHRIGYHYLGPNHSDGNLALLLPAAAGPVLAFVDVSEPNYRNLPDTDFDGLRAAMRRSLELDWTHTVSGHTRPNDRDWFRVRLDYLEALVPAVATAWEDAQRLQPQSGESMVAFQERQRATACLNAREALRPRFGALPAFEEYTPLTADRVITYLTIGV